MRQWWRWEDVKGKRVCVQFSALCIEKLKLKHFLEISIFLLNNSNKNFLCVCVLSIWQCLRCCFFFHSCCCCYCCYWWYCCWFWCYDFFSAHCACLSRFVWDERIIMHRNQKSKHLTIQQMCWYIDLITRYNLS